MVKHLHSDFLVDQSKYCSAVSFWRLFCKDTLEKSGQADLWQPWLSIHQQNYRSIVEEGPIYSLYSQAQQKALTIQQYVPSTDEIEISARVDIFGEGVLEKPIDYLLICCALSIESAAIAKHLIELWVRKETTCSDMDDEIRKTLS